jgi:hypothetical protein
MGRDSFGWPMPLPALVPDELSGPPKPRLRETLAPIFDLHHRLTRSRAKHVQEFDGPAPVTEVSVYLKIHVQRWGSISARVVSAPHAGHGFLGLKGMCFPSARRWVGAV